MLLGVFTPAGPVDTQSENLEYSEFKGSARGMHWVCGIPFFFLTLYYENFQTERKVQRLM